MRLARLEGRWRLQDLDRPDFREGRERPLVPDRLAHQQVRSDPKDPLALGFLHLH
jgi:hypothetical protein